MAMPTVLKRVSLPEAEASAGDSGLNAGTKTAKPFNSGYLDLLSYQELLC